MFSGIGMRQEHLFDLNADIVGNASKAVPCFD